MRRPVCTISVLLAVVLLAGWTSLQPTRASGGPSVASPSTPCAPEVERQFRSLKHHGEALGFHLGAATPDPTFEKHYQGIQRLPGPGTPYFFVSKNGNPTNPVGTEEEGHLLVVQFGSRDEDGERLRSNRLRRGAETEETPPPSQDEVIWDISFDEPGWAYGHVGGMQTYGDVLAVPLEKPMHDSLPTGKVVFFDVSDPTFPVSLFEVPVNHNAGTAALTRLPDGRFLLAVGGAADNIELRTYISSSRDLRDPAMTFSPFYVWYKEQLPSGEWPTGGEGHQTLNFINDCDGTLYLVGTNSDAVPGTGSDDYVHLYRVELNAPDPISDPTQNRFELHYLRKQHIYCESAGGTLCSLRAAGGAYVSPGGELILYATEHDNDGPGGTVRMGEFRHLEMFHFSSPAWAPSADAGGPYSVPEGASVLLDGTQTRSPFAQAWAELYDDDTWNDRSVVLDYADRALENWEEFDRLDDFTDRASSARWAAPVGCDIVLYEHDGYTGDSYTLRGDGTVRSIHDLGSFGDDASSARFEGSTCEARDIDLRWDVDGDAHHETAGATATYDASAIDGPWVHHSNLNACGAWLNACDVARVGITITNAPPSATIDSIVDERGQVVGADVHWVLQGLDTGVLAGFTDPGKPDTHTATFDWGDGRSEEQSDFDRFEDSTGGVAGVASSWHAYAEPGTYALTLTVIDDDGGLGTASRDVRVLSAADALTEVRQDLEELAADPLLDPLAKEHLDRAVERLGGAPGQDGAIDRLRGGTLNAALVKIGKALVELNEAEAQQPGLDLSTAKTSITLAAKSVVMGAISLAEGSDRLDEARNLVASGDARLAAGDHVGAVNDYREALSRIAS